MRIKQAAKNDIKKVIEFFSQDEKNILGSDEMEYTQNDIKDYLTEKSNKIFICELDGLTVGAIFVSFFTDYVLINTLVVDKKYRQKDVASFLLDYVEKLAFTKKIVYFELEVEENNKIMQNLVAKRGYTLGRRFIYYHKELK